MTVRPRALILVLTGPVFTPALVFAQIGGSGSIQGNVLDPSGGALAGRDGHRDAQRHRRDHDAQTTTPPASTRCRRCRRASTVSRVTSQDSRHIVQESVVVDALAVVGLNVTLQVGAIAQEVTVSAAPPLLSTADARLGQTIRNEVYTALPLVMNTGGPRDPTRSCSSCPASSRSAAGAT